MGLLPNGPGQSPYQDGHLAVDFLQKNAFLDGQPINLRRKEYELLAMLVQSAGEVVARKVLLESIWGYNDRVRTRTLDVHIRRLRIKLGSYSGRYIETIFSVGYRFQPIGLRASAASVADSRAGAPR